MNPEFKDFTNINTRKMPSLKPKDYGIILLKGTITIAKTFLL